MAVTIGGISCEEIVRDYQEGASLQGGPTSTKGYLCGWADRYVVMKGLLGLSSTVSIGGAITLQTPMRHPAFPQCYATNVSIQGVGMPAAGPLGLQYDKAILWTNFNVVPWSFNSFDNPYQQIDPSSPFVYAEQRISTGVQVLQIDRKGCKFESTIPAVSPKLDFAFRIPTATLEIEIKQLPYIPMPTILQFGGSINDDTFLGVAKGSLMFDGIDTQQGAVSDGTYIQQALYRFQYRYIRWDYDYNPTANAFNRVVKLDGSAFIPLNDFNQIIPSYYGY